MNENADDVERGDAQGDLGCRGAFEIIVSRLQAAERLQEWLAKVLHSDFPDFPQGVTMFSDHLDNCQFAK